MEQFIEPLDKYFFKSLHMYFTLSIRFDTSGENIKLTLEEEKKHLSFIQSYLYNSLADTYVICI